MSDWKPAGQVSLSPYLICAWPDEQLAFVEAAFNAEILTRRTREDGSVMHAEVLIDDCVLMLGGMPDAPPMSATHLHLYVPDAAEVFAAAVAAGGVAVQPPMRKEGESGDLRGGVRGPNGETWWIASAG